MKLQFYLRFHTSFGQTLWLSENGGQLGADMIEGAIPMTYLNEEYWEVSIKVPKSRKNNLQYKYLLKDSDGEIVPEWGDDRVIQFSKPRPKELVLIDTWNHAGEFENAFFTSPFKDILLKQKKTGRGSPKHKDHTHVFRVKAPLLSKDETVCLVGSGKTLAEWSTARPVILSKEGNWFTGYVSLEDDNFPVAYKYGIYDTARKKFLRFEKGDNRILYSESGKKKLTIIHDGFVHLPNSTWKGAGVSIPVFSLRSKKSLGIGEFPDLKLLVDWAKSAGLRMIQILPVNDTTATHTWTDSYPYASISAFALNPVYINLSSVAGKKNSAIVKKAAGNQKLLNDLPEIDFEAVMKAKLELLKELYEAEGKEVLAGEDFQHFFRRNEHWLVSYAAFCFLRDQNGTADFEQWKSFGTYDAKAIQELCAPTSAYYPEVAFYYFVQFHLHLQLKEAADYAHKKGVILKGDIPIGIYRYGCDAWTAPELYNLRMQAGAPPDDFAVKGQNWGFPTYNWKKMQDDHFEWWRRRFEQMSHYFDAFRIDHILGFFRIWSIPMDSVEGIMGRFIPAIPINIAEFGERGIWFDRNRYCHPFISDEILQQQFGSCSSTVKKEYLRLNDTGTYDLKPGFRTQREIEDHINTAGSDPDQEKLKAGLFNLVSNVILLEEEDSQGTNFHFRIAMDTTSSFRQLDPEVQVKLKELYLDYFFGRQDQFWMKEAMHKLPYLKRATNMLICGEDLGMVPKCVPEVMNQLGILSLEIQRMPKASGREFFHPNDAPYLSVVTPSTHDMSTIRGWWEEDFEKSTRFFNNELGQWGKPPAFCEPWINRAIILQHLYSPAMWSIFQLQDLLGMSEKLRRENPHEERINVPSNPRHYWRYRMHISLEDLIKQKDFNQELKDYVSHSGR